MPPLTASRPRVGVAPTVTRWRRGDELILVDTFLPGPKQVEFFQACHDPRYREILFHGSIRGGKSQACGKMLAYWAMHYPGTYGVFRATEKELDDSTKKIMLRGDGMMPPSIPPQLVAKTHEGLNKVILKNGAEILFRSLEEKERGKIRNITFAGGFIDQVEELESEEEADYYDELLGRISDPDPRAPRKMLLAANPGPETHFIAQRFGCTEDSAAFAHARTKQIHVSILDNIDNLDPVYVQDLLATKDTRPDYYNRMVMGRWGSFGGKRFKNWDKRKNVVDPRDLPLPLYWEQAWDVYEGLDWGYAHATVCEWGVVDYQGAVWVAAEHYAKQRSVKEHAQAMMRTRRNDDSWTGVPGSLMPSATYLDPSAWNKQRQEIATVADSFREHGIYPVKAQNERLGGWNLMDEWLTEIMPDGYSRLRFMPWCKEAIKEIPNLRIKVGTDDVEKEHDDAADATRYMCMSKPAASHEAKSPQEEHTREAVARRVYEKSRAREEHRVIIPLGGG